MTEKRATGEHNKAKIAAELGGVGLGIVAAGATAGYVRYRKRRLESQQAIDETDIPKYQKALELFTNEKVLKRLPDGHYIMAAAAVRIFYASHDSSEQIITKTNLKAQLDQGEERLRIPEHRLQTALSYLADKDYQLIGRRSREDNHRIRGYYALPALQWAMESGEIPDVVIEAQSNFINENM